jgi:diguanylate cyclase (GGDEF)-like protein
LHSQSPPRFRSFALRVGGVLLVTTLATYAVVAFVTRHALRALPEPAPIGALGTDGIAALLATAVSLALGAWLLRPAARAFDELSRRLGESRRELEEQRAAIQEANRRLLAQNEALRRANEVLSQLSVTDGLTRLHNHRHFQDQFVREAKRAERTGQPLALALVDIDDFKRLNDQLGHAAGDAVLQGVARLMAEELRDSDFLSRYGGEEFALLAPQTDLAGATALAEKLRTNISEARLPVVGPQGRVVVTVSVGVALYDGSTAATFEAADRALYQAKASGKDCVVSAGRPDLGPPLPEWRRRR